MASKYSGTTVFFSLYDTLPILRAKSKSPWELGHCIGLLISHMRPLISTHLDNASYISSPCPSALAGYEDFVCAVDTNVSSLRYADGISSALPTNDRKEKAKKSKLVGRYTRILEASFVTAILTGLEDSFAGYGKEETSMFNKGVDKALSGVQWVEYPGWKIVLLVIGDWADWLKDECQRLGMKRAKAGEKVLEDM
jgi:glycosyltransferase involved in cell wall biosynthesis